MATYESTGGPPSQLPWEKKFTVFAVYEDNLQPYSTIVSAGSPEIAVRLAQLQCLEDNGAPLAEDVPPDYGSCTLMGFQVVEGEVETIPFDDMPIEAGHEVFWGGSRSAPWSVEEIITDGPQLKARIQYALSEEIVPVEELTPYPDLNL